VVSADSDHRLLSCNPSGCAGVSQLYRCLCDLGSTQESDRAPKGRHRLLVINPSLFTDSLSPLRGSANLTNLTQGSQSLALGLTLTAAPQLVEGSRLISIGCDRIDTAAPGPRCPTTTRRHSCPQVMNPPLKNSAVALRRSRTSLRRLIGFLGKTVARRFFRECFRCLARFFIAWILLCGCLLGNECGLVLNFWLRGLKENASIRISTYVCFAPQRNLHGIR